MEQIAGRRLSGLVLCAAVLAWTLRAQGGDFQLPIFGRDTVLVWKIANQNEISSFVVRIAEFTPDRYFEWENSSTQGTIFIPEKSIIEGTNFLSTRLFEGGVDTRGKDATTLWLSRHTYRKLKEKGKIKLTLDSLDDQMTVLGVDHLPIEVNRVVAQLPVIKVSDRRGSERWFLDLEDNPLMVRHAIRSFTQTLTSITTDRPNTLRWIKGKKLINPH